MSDDSGATLHEQKTGTSAQASPHWLNRALWMGPVVAEAREKNFDSGKPGFAWFDISRQLCDDVVKIGETGKGSIAVLLLDCQQVELLVRTHLERADLLTGARPLAQDDWQRARTLPAVGQALDKLSVAQLATLTGLLGPEREATLVKLPGEERESFANAIHALVIQLSEPLEFEANRLGRALFARWSRIIVAAAVVVLVVGGAGNWMSKKFGKPNLALHRPVTISSQFPYQGTDHTLLVDGDRDNLGFHTNNDGQQWVVIDLGAVHKFDKVVVYNRSDGYQERAVPLKLKVSKDGQNYTLLGEKKETFDKWTVKGLHTEGRYIRLENTPPNYLHLSEVEVY